MLPMFLIDKGVHASTVGFWTGVVGQVLSIMGSILGGAAVSGSKYEICLLEQKYEKKPIIFTVVLAPWSR